MVDADGARSLSSKHTTVNYRYGGAGTYDLLNARAGQLDHAIYLVYDFATLRGRFPTHSRLFDVACHTISAMSLPQPGCQPCQLCGLPEVHICTHISELKDEHARVQVLRAILSPPASRKTFSMISYWSRAFVCFSRLYRTLAKGRRELSSRRCRYLRMHPFALDI